MTTDHFTPSMLRIATIALLLLVPAGIALAQPEENARYALAQRYEKNGDLPNASKIYLELYRSSPGTRIYFDGVRRTYTAMLRFADLLPIVQGEMQQHRGDVDLMMLNAELLHRTGRRDEAAGAWRSITELSPSDPNIWLRVSAAQHTLGLDADALATLDRGREKMGVPNVYILEHAELLGRVGRVEESVAEYSTLLRGDPAQLPLVQRGLTPALESESAIRRAIATVRRDNDRSSNETLLQLLVWLYGEANDLDGMFTVVFQLDSLGNDNGSALYALAERLAGDERWTQASRAYQAVLDRHPSSSLVPNARIGVVRALEGEAGGIDMLEPKKRKELADRYLSLHEGDENLRVDATYRAATLLAEDEPEHALELVERLDPPSGNRGSAENPGLLQADLLVRLDRLNEAEKLLRSIAYNGRGDTNAADGAALRLGRMQFYRGEFDSAMNSYVGLTNDPGTEVANDALEELALVQENRGRNDSALALYARARLAILQHRTAQADEYLQGVARRAPSTPLAERAQMARAELLERTGGDALPVYLDLVQHYPSGLFPDRALYRAARLKEKRGDLLLEVTALYMRILSDYPTSPLLEETRTALQRLRPAP